MNEEVGKFYSHFGHVDHSTNQFKATNLFASLWHKKKLVARYVNIHAKNYYIQDHPLPKEGF